MIVPPYDVIASDERASFFDRDPHNAIRLELTREAGSEEAHLSPAAHPAGGRWGAYDISRLEADCGWRPRPLEEALAEYRDWLRTYPY